MATRLVMENEENIKDLVSTFEAVRKNSLEEYLDNMNDAQLVNKMIQNGQLFQDKIYGEKVLKRNPAEKTNFAGMDAFEAYKLLKKELCDEEMHAAQAEYPMDYIIAAGEKIYKILIFDQSFMQKIQFYAGMKKVFSSNENDDENLIIVIPARYSIENLNLNILNINSLNLKGTYRLLLIRDMEGKTYSKMSNQFRF